MTNWKTLNELPLIGQRVLVAAWEFGCEPRYFIVYFWQSSLPGQPPKFSFDETYRAPVPCTLGEVVHFWMPIPELPDEVVERNLTPARADETTLWECDNCKSYNNLRAIACAICGALRETQGRQT